MAENLPCEKSSVVALEVGDVVWITGHMCPLYQNNVRRWKPLSWLYTKPQKAIYLGMNTVYEGKRYFVDEEVGYAFTQIGTVPVHMVQVVSGRRYLKPTPVAWEHMLLEAPNE